jgi:hypothetical protein
MAAQPFLHLGVFVGGVVVQHQVDLAAGVAAGHQPQKAQEFLYVLDPDDPFPEGYAVGDTRARARAVRQYPTATVGRRTGRTEETSRQAMTKS